MYCEEVRNNVLDIGGIEMPKECYVCGKKITSGHQVSHSNIHTKRTWKPNLKKVRIVENNTAKNVQVCTRCLRSGKFEKA